MASQVEGVLEQLAIVTQRIQEVSMENRLLRREISGLRQQLTVPKSV
jgi:regulator of replication initiation timing